MEIRVKETRNKIISLLLAFVAIMTLTACPGEKKEPSPLNPVNPEGKTYQQAETLSAENADKTVTLTNLKTAIKDIEYNADWLTVIKQSYTSGSPSLRLTATANVKDGESTNSRSCTVTITANSGDKVLLNVTQQGAERKTGIDNPHDTPTDQPAYSREK